MILHVSSVRDVNYGSFTKSLLLKFAIVCHNSSRQQTVRGADIWTTFEPKNDEEVVDFKKSLQPTDNLSGDEPKILQVVHEFSDTNFVGASGGQSATSATIPKRRWQQNAAATPGWGKGMLKYMRYVDPLWVPIGSMGLENLDLLVIKIIQR